MDQEPHHHMVMENGFFKIFKVEVAPGDAIVLHRHDHDTVAIAIGDQEVTVGVPGKPDVHQKNLDGQVRLQPGGYMHSTHVDGAEPYHTVAVELLLPQTGARNLCAAVMNGQPLNCPEASAKSTPASYAESPMFESDETQIRLVRVFPHQDAAVGDLRLVIALDPGFISPARKGDPELSMRPGDYIWFDKAATGRKFENKSDKEARFIELSFQQRTPEK
jgi:uncharacterized Zn-binding protein involved in type VI secretion